MPQKKKGDRALVYRYPRFDASCPSRYPGYFLVVTIGADQRRVQKKYPFATPASEAVALQDAERDALITNEQAAIAEGITIATALEIYREHKTKQGRKPRSIEETIRHIENLFPEQAKRVGKQLVAPNADLRGQLIYPRQMPVADLDERLCAALYEYLCSRPKSAKPGSAPRAADTCINTLVEGKTFLAWCLQQKWVRYNPLATIKDERPRNPGGKGKQHLSFDELAKWEEKAFEMAESGDVGAAAALVALKLGLRATQIVTRTVRDVDLGGALFRALTHGKNRRAEKLIQVMDERLRSVLASLKMGKTPEAWLWPNEEGTSHHDRHWLRSQVRRVCRAAGVSQKTHAHGMRGAGASLDHIDGKTLSDIQTWLGHRQGDAVTERSYLSAEAIAAARQKKLMRVLPGSWRRRAAGEKE